MIGIKFNLPFEEQLEFFRKKGFVISAKSWRDVWQAAHARAFTVARVTALDVLVDIRKELDAAMESGASVAEFKKALKDKLESKGWLAPKGEKAKIKMPDGTTRKRLTGWRLDSIYRENLGTSYQVGRYKQMTEVKELRPFWQYMDAGDGDVRPHHHAQNRKVYHADHPFWNTWYPPNGFACRCYIKTLSKRQMNQRGLTEKTKGVAEKPDKGWRYNPGKAGLDKWKPDLKKYPKELRRQFKKEKPIFD